MFVRHCSVVALLVGLTTLLPGTARAAHPDRDYDRQVILCESHNGQSRFCHADTRGGVRLRYQHSRSACIEGRSWGWDRRGVWVSRGCRAEFVLGGRGYGRGDYGRDDYGRPGYGDPGYGGYDRLIVCASIESRYKVCPLGRSARGIRFERQISRAHCQEGYSWGYRRDGVWVDHGCRAEFRVY